MKNQGKKFLFFLSVSVLAVPFLNSCKGRTAENMVPTGDTVEVIIKTPGPEEEESHTLDTITNFKENLDIE